MNTFYNALNVKALKCPICHFNAAVAIVRLSQSYCGSVNDFDRKLQIV